MSLLSDLFKKAKVPAPALDLGAALLAPYVPVAKALGRDALVRKVAIPMEAVGRFRRLDTPDLKARALALRDLAASANADLVQFLADAE